MFVFQKIFREDEDLFRTKPISDSSVQFRVKGKNHLRIQTTDSALNLLYTFLAKKILLHKSYIPNHFNDFPSKVDTVPQECLKISCYENEQQLYGFTRCTKVNKKGHLLCQYPNQIFWNKERGSNDLQYKDKLRENILHNESVVILYMIYDIQQNESKL